LPALPPLPGAPPFPFEPPLLLPPLLAGPLLELVEQPPVASAEANNSAPSSPMGLSKSGMKSPAKAHRPAFDLGAQAVRVSTVALAPVPSPLEA
jgi:hypothetical protein